MNDLETKETMTVGRLHRELEGLPDDMTVTPGAARGDEPVKVEDDSNPKFKLF